VSREWDGWVFGETSEGEGGASSFFPSFSFSPFMLYTSLFLPDERHTHPCPSPQLEAAIWAQIDLAETQDGVD
jgi:hypothetical protein